MSEVVLNSLEPIGLLAAKCLATDTEIQVSEIAPEEAWGHELRIQLDRELLLATIPADGSSPWTVERNVEPVVGGSGAALHAVGTEIKLVLTAAQVGQSTGGAVASVFGRTGAVEAESGDYSYGMISGLGSAATQSTAAFDAAGAAQAALEAAEAAVAAERTRAEGIEAVLAPLAGATFTGPVVVPVPTVPGSAINKQWFEEHSSGGSATLPFVSVKAAPYEAKGNGRRGVDGAIEASTKVFSSTSYTFTSEDVGKVLSIQGANNNSSGVLCTRISSVSEGKAHVESEAKVTVTGKEWTIASDDTAAINAAVAAVAPTGGIVFFPAGIYGVKAAISVPGGVTLVGTGVDYTNPAGEVVAEVPIATPPERGSILVCIYESKNGSVGAVVELGTSAESASVKSGGVGAAMRSLIVDANNYAVAAVRTRARRNEVILSQCWRGSSYALQISGQNGYVIGGVIGNENKGSPLYVTGADTHVFMAQIRQGGVAQVESYGNEDLQIVGCHIFGGFNGSLTGTTGHDIYIHGTASKINIIGNTMDGTNGDHVRIQPEEGKTIQQVNFVGNMGWQVAAIGDYWCNILAEATSSVVHYVNVVANTTYGGNGDWKAFTNIVTNGTTNVTNVASAFNQGSGVEKIYEGVRPEILYGCSFRNSSGAVRRSEQSGVETFTGNGAATTFTIPHALGQEPRTARVSPRSQAALNCWATTTTSGVVVNFAAAPASAAEVKVDWEAAL